MSKFDNYSYNSSNQSDEDEDDVMDFVQISKAAPRKNPFSSIANVPVFKNSETRLSKLVPKTDTVMTESQKDTTSS